MDILVVGAGFSGAVIARILAEQGYRCQVVDERRHLAGNCHTERDQDTGIMVHYYGPHIFHTSNEQVWRFVNQFAEFKPYTNRVKTTIKGRVYSLPINLHTINQFFNKAFSPKQAKEFLREVADNNIQTPKNFEEQALKFVGSDLYKAFFKGYTRKQWGIHPRDLPASILKRLPIRFTYDDNYFSDPYQGIPAEGYTALIKKMLEHENIKITLNTKVKRSEAKHYNHVFYSGPIDGWFSYCYGMLGYRTLDFEEIRDNGDIQGCAVMNYGDYEVPFTRISEHKFFAPWEHHNASLAFKEFSRQCESGDIPYYPIRLVNEQNLLRKYIALAKEEQNTSFVGRLGTYRYLDMDVTVAEAMHVAEQFLEIKKKNGQCPTFFNEPI